MLGSLHSQIEDVKRADPFYSHAPSLDKAAYAAVSITSYCGIKFASSSPLVKSGDGRVFCSVFMKLGTMS